MAIGTPQQHDHDEDVMNCNILNATDRVNTGLLECQVVSTQNINTNVITTNVANAHIVHTPVINVDDI